jgi:hypothetical protein
MFRFLLQPFKHVHHHLLGILNNLGVETLNPHGPRGNAFCDMRYAIPYFEVYARLHR